MLLAALIQHFIETNLASIVLLHHPHLHQFTAYRARSGLRAARLDMGLIVLLVFLLVAVDALGHAHRASVLVLHKLVFSYVLKGAALRTRFLCMLLEHMLVLVGLQDNLAALVAPGIVTSALSLMEAEL